MARQYASVQTSIWQNKEFRALTEPEQRLFLMLVSQGDMGAAGVLPLRVNRWADMSVTSTPDSIRTDLKSLEAGKTIAIDWDTEEVLIRCFIRWDGGAKNPKRRPVIERDIAATVSDRLRHYAELDLSRCLGAHIEVPRNIESTTSNPQVDSLSDSLSDSVSPREGLVTTRNPQPTTRKTSSSAKPTVPQEVFDRFWSVYPKKVSKIKTKKDLAKALKIATIEEIVAGAIRYRDDPKRSPAYTKDPTGWLNDGRWMDIPDGSAAQELTFDGLLQTGAAQQAAKLIGGFFKPPTPPTGLSALQDATWVRDKAREFIQDHADEIRAALPSGA